MALSLKGAKKHPLIRQGISYKKLEYLIPKKDLIYNLSSTGVSLPGNHMNGL